MLPPASTCHPATRPAPRPPKTQILRLGGGSKSRDDSGLSHAHLPRWGDGRGGIGTLFYKENSRRLCSEVFPPTPVVSEPTAALNASGARLCGRHVLRVLMSSVPESSALGVRPVLPLHSFIDQEAGVLRGCLHLPNVFQLAKDRI